MKNNRNKEKIKNTFYCSLELIGVGGFMQAVMIGIFLFIYFVPKSPEVEAGMGLIYGLSIGCVVICFIVYLWMIYRFSAKVIIDETGVKSSIFGAFQKKSLSWEEIVFIKRLNLSFAPWVYISDIDLTHMKLTSAVMRRTITVMDQKGLKEAFEKYCPDFEKFGCKL